MNLKIACSAKRLTEHLPWPDHTVKVVQDRSGGWPNCTSALPPDVLGIEHRPDGRLMRRCGTNSGNAKIVEVHAEFSSLDTGVVMPMDVVRCRS